MAKYISFVTGSGCKGSAGRNGGAPRANSRSAMICCRLLAISDVPLRELRRAKRKLRRLDPGHLCEVARALGALGFCQPILADRVP